MDHAAPAASEEELGGVSIHVELVIGGNDFKSVINDVLVEDGGSGFFIGIVEPTESWVDARHWATGCRRACLFIVLVFQN